MCLIKSGDCMNYTVISLEKRKEELNFLLENNNTHKSINILFKKHFIPNKKPELENEIRQKNTNWTFSKKLLSNVYGPGKILKSKNIPAELQNEEIYLLLVDYYGLTLGYLDEEEITYEMCLCAVKNDPMALRNVPTAFMDEKIIEIALLKNGVTLQFIPKKLRTETYCNIAFHSSPNSLRYIPAEFKTYEMCVNAVIRDMYCIHYVPDEYLLAVYKEAIIDRNLALPQFDGGRKSYNKAYMYKDIVKKIKLFLQRETSLETSLLDSDLSLSETLEKTEMTRELLDRKKKLIDEVKEIDSQLHEISKIKK